MKYVIRILTIFLIALFFTKPVLAEVDVVDFSELFDHHGSIMLVMDVESGKIIDANQAAVDFYGYTHETMLIMDIEDINTLTPSEIQRERGAAAQQQRNYFVFSHRLANGDIRRVEVYSYPFMNNGKQLLYSIIHDITPKIQLENSLKQRNKMFYTILIIMVLILLVFSIFLEKSLKSNKRIQKQMENINLTFQNLFNHMQEGFALHEVICDKEGKPVDYRFTDVNKAFEEITGLKIDDIKNKTVLEVLPQTESYWIEKYGEVALMGKPLHYENYSKALGKYFSVNVYCPEEGKFATLFSDITSQVQAKEAVKKERELFKTTLWSMGDGVISTDVHGNVEIINTVAEKLTGCSQKEAYGRPFEEVFNIINEYTREKCENPVKKVFDTGEVIELVNHTLLIAKDGSEKPVEDSAAPIRGESGNINGVVVVFRDFTEKKEKQERIEYLSYHDQLTGLYNRRFFEEELKRLDTKRNLPMTIIMADVNGLKLTNDAFGHVLGDKLLKKAAEVIKKECRYDEIVSRIGGDEFTVILPKTDEMEAKNIIKRIREAVSNEKVESIDLSISFGWETKKTMDEEIAEVLRKAEDHMYRRKLFESPSMRSNMIKSIISSINDRNKIQEEHSERVRNISEKAGIAYDLSEDELNQLKSACLLHDVGKIAIDENILNKADKLSETEWIEIKRHAEIGYRILSSVNEYAQIAEAVLSHHERWDGTGYPKSLKGEDIPWIARIVSIADAYDAMISDRPYRKALSEERAIAEIIRNAGSQFDPEAARIFVKKVLGKSWDHGSK